MVEIGFASKATKRQNFLLAQRLDANDVLFVIHILDETLQTITLSAQRPSLTLHDIPFSAIGDQLWIGGEVIDTGYVKLEKMNVTLFVVAGTMAKTTYFTINSNDYFVLGTSKTSGIVTNGKSQVIIWQDKILIKPKKSFLYLNDSCMQKDEMIAQIKVGDRVFTPDFLLEKRRRQWKITTFSNKVIFDKKQMLVQMPHEEIFENFPQYRRSPRIHLEPPEEHFKIEKKAESPMTNKNNLLQAILPPIGMVAIGGLTTMLSGGNPLMMVGMAFMSLMTASFTVSQYITEKKERQHEAKVQQEKYDVYLLDTSAKIGKYYNDETMVLKFKHPAPEKIARLIETYDARIYERMRNNKDFLEVSVGKGNVNSHLKLESDINSRDTDDNTLRVKRLLERYRSQRHVPITVNMLVQTIGLVGTYPILKTAAAHLLLQIAFFHSYRDVNFISLVPEHTYHEDWACWRFLPHFKLQEIGLRGLVYNAKTRDIVLSSFYQLLNKRKQILTEAGKETPQFSPHYVFTIFDDRYLAGHNLNEFLADDMSALGVSVIWVKEDQKLLPETVTAVIMYKNQKAGEIVNDNNVYVAKAFVPDTPLENLEESLRRLANLEHVEVEKNAIPESLSLLEQYEVKEVAELNIGDRWEKAEPNKSMKSLIGWRGKHEYMYWDLHERVHGPHALVGGTTGSGKSEFLTTYLIGLAINFSPEDIGMLIIDWKGGGIANTLAGLPHFMGSITNLDGAGTARALASIKAELDKRMKEFAKYGVNSINGYMSLYKKRHEAKPDIIYPQQPIPHLVLVSDEFAELKANVPEFLDELTSVARIGRSLGVHLILATQKPSGVVNDQIEANSRSKIALKMASKQDSNELLKTHDAAHITNPGRGYLKVGENEVYDLFQSGYAGVPYDVSADINDVIDERIYKITELGQLELVYDPGEDVTQGKDMSDLPTQLEAVITEIEQVFATSGLVLPAKPWLPNLDVALTTPKVTQSKTRALQIPLGFIDLPSEQLQKEYNFDLNEASHTVIFSSPGFGKSTTLQTIALNLARKNTPDHVQFNLFDFGTNGLLPIKGLPHVADIVTLEEEEKLTKMMKRLYGILADRKQALKNVGVATLAQYEQKTKENLPVLVNLLDNYDALTQSKRRDEIDELFIQILREGAALGVYLIVTAGRFNAIKMNMMSNIQTKIGLFLNDDHELSHLFGREYLTQSEIIGRGQIKVDVPLAIQIYLPAKGENDLERLEAIEQEIAVLNKAWDGKLPDRIPMVPTELTRALFENYRPEKTKDMLYFGLNKRTSQPESFPLFTGKGLAIFTANRKQFNLISPFIFNEILQQVQDADVILIDALKSLTEYAQDVSLYISRDALDMQSLHLKEALQYIGQGDKGMKRVIIINGIGDVIEKIGYQRTQVVALIEQNNAQTQLIFLDYVSRVGKGVGFLTTTVRDHVYQILFGGGLAGQNFIDNIPNDLKKEEIAAHTLYSLKDEYLSPIVIPTDKEQDNE